MATKVKSKRGGPQPGSGRKKLTKPKKALWLYIREEDIEKMGGRPHTTANNIKKNMEDVRAVLYSNLEEHLGHPHGVYYQSIRFTK